MHSKIPKYIFNKREQNILEYNSIKDLEAKELKGTHSFIHSGVFLLNTVHIAWIDEAALYETENLSLKSQNPDVNYKKTCSIPMPIC